MSSENSTTFHVREMSCASCVGRVEKALLVVAGVQSASVNLAAETATVVMAEGSDMEPVVTALKDAGYPAELQTYRFSIENMSCASCVGRVERALGAVPGVVKASVNLAQERATVQALGVSAAQISQVASAAGYPARLITDE
ncbi:heavy-metal-associated domain-containing protein, partial [Sulfitobacter sp.]|uniref:heavy-metal-associated domain-containing protein n=1 Tax=Sulfitobacter sp. TaxID=1903071 RepID=UPI003566D7B4